MVIQIRCPRMGGGPFLAEVLRILEKSYSKTGGAGCPERGSFIDRRLHHRPVKDIGLKLHEQIVLHHASINSEQLKTRATVFLHCLDDLARLKRSCLQNRSREMALVRISCQSGNYAPRIMLPVRSVQPRKRRHEIHASIVLDGPRKCFDFRARADQAEVVAQPLHQRARDRDAAFKCVMCRFAAEPECNRREQTALGLNGLLASVHQEKASSAISILCFTGTKAGLPDERSLLIAQNARDGNSAKRPFFHLAINFAARTNLWEHRFRDAEGVQKLLIPGKRLQIHELRAAGVGDVGDVNSAAWASGEMPDKEGIDVAKQQIACACLFACAAHMIENPANFQAAEVSAERQPGFCAKTILSSLAS